MSAYQLQQVSFKYEESLVLSLPDLAIKEQQTTVLIGPNGSGKSTLLQLLAFLSAPTTGSIKYRGSAVTPSNRQEYRKCVAFLAQKPYMLTGSVLDNLTLALKFRGVSKKKRQQKAISALEQLNIRHLKNHPAKLLSGGEIQKAALARALVLQPDVLLLDEPFSYLDQSASRLFEQFIEAYTSNSDTTLIFSTHNRLQGYALADNVITLMNGERVSTPLINLFHGRIEHHCFNTGKLEILLPDDIVRGQHLAIDPHEIVLSNQPLSSSIRNSYQGRVTTIAEEMGKVRVSIEAGEKFQVLITYQALNDLALVLGGSIWISFKSNSVVVF
jgi:tungstate transport system ATP-binding protein